MDCIEKGEMTGTLFLDFRSAFDLVDQATLITKLSLYKFSQSAIRWFTSYLCCRQQAVESGKGLSEFYHVRSGIPQRFNPRAHFIPFIYK